MTLKIISPTEILFSGDIHLVKVPGTSGSFEVLKNHAPITSVLEKGNIKVITAKGEEKNFEIEGGFIEVSKNNTSILIN